MIKSGFGCWELLIKDIIYLECNGHEVTIKMSTNAVYKVYGSLKQR